MDDVFDWLFGANWKSYELDLATRKTIELPGLGWHSDGYYSASFDGADYLLMPGDGYTTTTIYRIGQDGAATMTAHTKGWATRLRRLR